MSDSRSPQISVIVPHLNQPDELQRCLRSLQQQTFDMRRVEIVVVDNGSRELPTKICARFGASLEQEPIAGPGPARNKGVSVSCGPLLAFIDADCIADPNWLATIDVAFSDPAIQIAGGNVRIAMVNPAKPTMIEAYEAVYGFRQQEYIERQGFSCTLNMAVRRSDFERVGPFGGVDIAEDRDWGVRAASMSIVTVFVPQMLVLHPARPSMAELRKKLDRLISHDFEERPRGLTGRTRWVLRALAVAASPIVELRTIATSPYLDTTHERVFAAIVLFNVRLYRAATMLWLALGGPQGARFSRTWNRT